MENPTIVSVDDTPTLISNAGTRRIARLIRNLGSSSVFLGGAAVEADNANSLMGWELAAGSQFEDTMSSSALYAVSPSGDTNNVQVWEVD